MEKCYFIILRYAIFLFQIIYLSDNVFIDKFNFGFGGMKWKFLYNLLHNLMQLYYNLIE